MASKNTSTLTYSNGTTVTWTPTDAPKAHENNSYINWRSGDTCACSKGSQRSCTSCLDSLIEYGGPCIVTPMGLCTSASNAAKSNLINRLSGSYYWSNNASYCSNNDTLCSTCRVQWLEVHARGGLNSLQTECRGDSDCICTPLCELRALGVIKPYDASFSTGIEMCSMTETGPSDWATGYAANVALMRNITFLLCGAMLVAMTVRYAAVQFHQRRYEQRMLTRRQALREQRDTAAATRSGFTLSLSGWNSYRERLIEHEHQQLGSKTDASSLSQAALASTSPMRVVVEEGEGFRPASPSQLTRRHSDAE